MVQLSLIVIPEVTQSTFEVSMLLENQKMKNQTFRCQIRRRTNKRSHQKRTQQFKNFLKRKCRMQILDTIIKHFSGGEVLSQFLRHFHVRARLWGF